jgi:hypothetical protein
VWSEDDSRIPNYVSRYGKSLPGFETRPSVSLIIAHITKKRHPKSDTRDFPISVYLWSTLKDIGLITAPNPGTKKQSQNDCIKTLVAFVSNIPNEHNEVIFTSQGSPTWDVAGIVTMS